MMGPKPPEPSLSAEPETLNIPIEKLDEMIAKKELAHLNLKPDNDARIVWFNDSREKTDLSVVFLHGYSASRMEGRPITTEFAERYGCNLYESRLAKHGLDTSDAMIDITPENYLQSAREAIAIGKLLGDSVIIICSSTGATLGLYLATEDPLIHSILCYSPNIDLVDQNSKMLTMPWGLQLARLIFRGDFREYEANEEFKKYWVNRYRLEALITMRSLLDATMTESNFAKIHQPVFVGAWFKDVITQDPIVSVPAMRNLMTQLSTPSGKKKMVEFTDVEAHIITSPIRCQDLESVRRETFLFAEEVLRLVPISNRDTL